jgi:YD repeat-containing protein
MVWFLVTRPSSSVCWSYYVCFGVSSALRFRTGHEVLSSTGRCRFYTTGYSDTFGFHELSCPGQGRLISRHNAFRDCLCSLGQQAGLENLSIWYGGYTSWFFIWFVRDLCVDVTIVNPFTDIDKKIRDPDSFLQSAVTHKRQHYADRCSAAGKLWLQW